MARSKCSTRGIDDRTRQEQVSARVLKRLVRIFSGFLSREHEVDALDDGGALEVRLSLQTERPNRSGAWTSAHSPQRVGAKEKIGILTAVCVGGEAPRVSKISRRMIAVPEP